MMQRETTILIIDNYDSFTYNLVHFLGELGEKTLVYRNDEIEVEEAIKMNPDAIILSPGPCDPDNTNTNRIIDYKRPVIVGCAYSLETI